MRNVKSIPCFILENITAELISSILNRKVTDLQLDNNPILERDVLDDKMGILDIKAKIDNTINCDIEMQIVDRRNIEKRIFKNHIDRRT